MSTTFVTPPLAEHLPPDAFETGAAPDGMPGITVQPDRLPEVCRILRDHPALRFVVCVDVTAVDYAPRVPRFDVVYHLVSLEHRFRLRIRVPTAAEVPTVSQIWASADWQEREVYDLFGVVFGGHPNLERLILPEDWEGHPLRRDHPVQVKLPVSTYAPLQLSEEEFRANVTADRERRGR